MRKIKFRAWHLHENKMYDVYNLDILFGRYWSEERRECLFSCDIELMQYTGLKDKNGKEIYEGDIVKYNYNNQVYQDVYAKVEYSIAGFRLNADYISRHLSRHLRIADTDYYEVVGNIYENPELLTV